MASQATHVVELDSGIGEPAFVPLTTGQELAPLSIGKKGMWRLESPRVLDVHAFMYFDGHSLFMQSADETQPVLADGARVAKTWTELFPPCKIEIGNTELTFRSLAPSEDETQMLPPVSAEPPPTVPTQTRPPPEPVRPGGAEIGRIQPQPAQRPSMNMFAPARPSIPMPVPPPQAPRRNPDGPSVAIKNAPERPFGPGAFASVDEDSTRVHPLSATSATNKPRPAAGEPARPSSGRMPVADVPSVIVPAEPPAYGGSGPYPPMPMNMAGQYAQTPIGAQMQQTGMQLQQMQMRDMQMQQPGMNGQPGMYGAPLTNIPMPQVTTTAQKDAVQEAIAQFKAASPPRKASIVLAPFVIVAAMYLLLVDDPQPQARRGVSSASPSGSASALASNRAPPVDPRYGTPADPRYGTAADPRYGTAADPRLDPRYGTPADPRYAADPRYGTAADPRYGTAADPRLAPGVDPRLAPPVDPRLAPATDPRLAPGVDPRLAPPVDPRLAPATDPRLAPPVDPRLATASPPPDPTASASADPAPALAKNEKTLERQAIDALARGDRVRATAMYMQLAQMYPQNRAFAEAARILRVGLPPMPETPQPGVPPNLAPPPPGVPAPTGPPPTTGPPPP